jgi:hypothetical protein
MWISGATTDHVILQTSNVELPKGGGKGGNLSGFDKKIARNPKFNFIKV